jgi:CelD/BcsL family acetyltransferase involved in cellulose biosynthesis
MLLIPTRARTPRGVAGFEPSRMNESSLSQNQAYRMSLSGDDWRSPEFRAEWVRLLRARTNHDALYQSPEFFEHLHATASPESLSMLSVRATDGSLVGAVPLQIVCWPLTFSLSDRLVGKANLRTVVILGSQPLIPSDPGLHGQLLATISATFRDCDAIAMSSVPVDSFLWRYCHEAPAVRRDFLIYVPNGKQICHTIPLPATFDDYLAKLGTKKRYNLRRQVRRLCESASGALTLRRIESPGDIPALIEAMKSLRCRLPWDHHAARLDDVGVLRKVTDLAARGMLLSYLLVSNGRPCAVAIGMQGNGVYRLNEMGHDDSLASLSPGSTLLFMMIEDLIGHGLALIDLGWGEPVYRHSSTNVYVERGMIFLLRRTLANRVRRRGHETMRALNGLLRQVRRSLRAD